MRHARRVAGIFVLASFFAPCVSGVLVVVHLFDHHAGEVHADHDDHPADFSALWHGHGHEAETPDHDHPVLVAGMQEFRIPAVQEATPGAAGPWHRLVLVAAATPRVWRSCPPGLAGVGPPPRRGPAILRI